MIISELYLNGFRNINANKYVFHNKKNLIFGNNGVGKTSILEALFLLGFKKSFLNVNLKDIVNYEKKEFLIKAIIKNPIKGQIEIKGVYLQNKLNIFLSNKKTNIQDINNYYYPLFFSSSNYIQYIEIASFLRKLFDRFIFGVNNIYYKDLLNYNRALKNKNYILKNRYNRIELKSWNMVLSEYELEIIQKRKFLILELNKILKIFDDSIKIIYEPSFLDIKNLSIENIYNAYEQIEKDEINYKRSLKGNHRDRYYILKNNKNLKFYSSGEKKIGLLYVYISFIEFFKKKKGEYPVLFTDDFDTAIDDNNLKIILKNYPEIQIIATSVNKNKYFDNYIHIN